MKAFILALTLAATPVAAGGPVSLEDTESAPVVVQDKRDHTALILLGIALAVIIASGGSDNCYGDEPQPEPGPCP